MTKYYPEIDPNPDFAALEEEVLQIWVREKTFEQSVAQRDAANAYVFYDGPPFANGLPHYGHLLTGYVKDAVARYQTMRGHRVERRFGWDCHGLPAEMGAEKELGISGRAAITEYGIGKFNEYCRSSVMKYTSEWEYYVTRQGRWVDFKHDYKTMDKGFMESCLWAFKELWNKGLVYESMRVMPYSWAAETPVSNFETRIDNATRPREDKAAYVKFRLREVPQFIRNNLAYANSNIEIENVSLVAWTTTPWTLPSNLALAVNKGLQYVARYVPSEKTVYVFATTYAPEFLKVKPREEAELALAPAIKGEDLLGLTYEPLFPYFADTPNAFRVLDGSAFVSDAEGTGIVHMAPGFGEDDQKCCAENGIEVIVPVDEKGRYTDAVYDVMLETERLVLRPFTSGDYALYHALQSDPKVAATTSDGLLPEEKIHAEFNRILGDQARKGFSQWAVLRKSDGAFIGRAGFDNRDYDQFNTSGKPDSELRYAFLSDYWGKGYATEVAQALLDWAALHRPEPLIIAGCNPTYQSAVKVLQKLGFTPHHHVDFRHQPVWYHTLEIEARRQAVVKKSPPNLCLSGLNVIAEKAAYTEADKANHISEKDVEKFGLANMRILRWLKANGKLVKDEVITHNYPHCWRTDTPLIYRAMSSWYINLNEPVAALNHQSVKQVMAANNQQITWIPDHVKNGQMGKGIESAPDWSISRNRFWGTPIPIWKSASGKIHVCGSIEEIERLSGQKVADLHRPVIDDIVLKIEGEEYRRIDDVFDCWFESGAMPFAQLHYPFENKERFEHAFPADFITEYIAQTRGWFYTLQVLSAALFGKAPFKNCICHGVVIDEETGLKYSKRLKNYKDPKEVMHHYGADALRWMMLASPVMRGADLAVDPDGKFIRDVVRLHIKPIWNAYNFFTLYANADGVKAQMVTGDTSSPATHLLDRYILAKCRAAVERVRASLDAYDTPGACEAISGFFEVLNNWYIRRSKER
ncbi:MAG: GNAT family N-acetyltransferase, partial [Alphaproteobacteria bacterium]